MRLLLTHGFFLDEDAKEREILRPYPPLGILYLSSYLRMRGHDVEVYDSTFGSRQELYSILDTESPGWLGIYVNLMTRTSALSVLRHARQRGWRVILGGPEPTNYAEQYLDAGAEFVVAGEGEWTLEQILQGNPAPDGIVYRRDGQLVRTPPARLVSNLDSLPWPDREQISVERYLQAWRSRHGQGSVSLITARGCPYRCRWCSHSTFGQTHRRRSVNGVADEAEWILERYSPEQLWYADDVFTIHTGWTVDYAREMKRRGVRVPFECITRADRLNEQTADALAQLGCFRVWIGSESGSQRLLDAMERGVRIEQVESAVELAKARGIQAGMFLMWGYEGEEAIDIEQTVAHVDRCRPDVFLTTISYPIQGTPYHREIADKLVPLAPWAESTDRDVKVRGRHSRRYYHFADELLKGTLGADAERVVRARQGMAESAAEVEA